MPRTAPTTTRQGGWTVGGREGVGGWGKGRREWERKGVGDGERVGEREGGRK